MASSKSKINGTLLLSFHERKVVATLNYSTAVNASSLYIENISYPFTYQSILLFYKLYSPK
jgi:hypothetical protein